jgi:CHAD domain-containing protein
MKSTMPPGQPPHHSLQLALPTEDPATVFSQLAQTPLLRRRKPTRYPEASQQLGPPAAPADPLQPQPTTGCTAHLQTTRWTLRQRRGTHIELVLQTGHVQAGELSSPVCQLDCVLLAGTPMALVDAVLQLARTVPMLPHAITLAERTHALATGSPALRPEPSAQTHKNMPLPQLAQALLSDMLQPFTANLVQLLHSDHPEVVHQARVGWRRFKSGLRLFKSALPPNALPDWAPLKPMLNALGELRDRDVALTQTLPPLQHAYTEHQPHRQAHWQALQNALTQATQTQRHTVRQALQNPAVGYTLLSALQALHTLPDPATLDETKHAKHPPKPPTLEHWAQRRLARLDQRLTSATQTLGPLENQHRARILAKRLRYSAEALRSLLPKKTRQRWTQQASHWQTQLGTTRDTARASTLAAELGADAELTAFLRGVAVGPQMGGGEG